MTRASKSSFDGKDGRHQFERYQYPKVLAWAVTIHKVQLISLDKAVTDVGSDISDHDQADVAFSRVRTLESALLFGLIRASCD